jgi:hypothetical protein
LADLSNKEPSDENPIMDMARDGIVAGGVFGSCDGAIRARFVRRLYRAIARSRGAGHKRPRQADPGIDGSGRSDGSGNLQCPECFIASLLYRDPTSATGNAVSSRRRLGFWGTLRVGLDEGGFSLFFEFMHERVSRALILELPKVVLYAFENQRIDRELHAFPDT